jgi:hypothetical protein
MPKHDCLSPRRTGRVSWLRQTSCCDVCDTTTRTAGRFQRPLALVQSQPAGGEDIGPVCLRPARDALDLQNERCWRIFNSSPMLRGARLP